MTSRRIEVSPDEVFTKATDIDVRETVSYLGAKRCAQLSTNKCKRQSLAREMANTAHFL
jgi:hypothetical protein